MGASFLQSDFLGGEWSAYMQGRMDREDYRKALSTCLNCMPIEEGSLTRRPGTQFVATTRKGGPAVLREFHFSQAAPFNMCLTPGHLRFISNAAFVMDINPQVVVSISGGNPAVVTTTTAHDWRTGDEVQFTLPAGSISVSIATLFKRQLEITVTGANTFTIADPVTGVGVDGSKITLDAITTVTRILDFTTAYTQPQLQAIRVVQSENVAILLHNAVPPQNVTTTGLNTFSLASAVFQDGPYLDPPVDGTTLTPNALGDTYITLTASSIASINGGQGFLAGDVNRLIRLYSEPAAWASGTSYAAGTAVKYGGEYWSSLVASNVGNYPGLDATNWAINPSGAIWTWGTITTVNSTSQVAVTLANPDPAGVLAGGYLLYTTPIVTWRLGVYSTTTGWPTCGCYYEGRLMLAGAIPNRFDASMSNLPFAFAPTDLYGTVSDNNGMSEVLNAAEVNPIFWMVSWLSTVVMGTQGGEWRIEASSLGDPITPTSIQVHRVTTFGCENIEVRTAPLAILFIQRYAHKVIEFLSDVYSRKFSGQNLALTARHLTSPGVAEIAFQRELVPVMWARMTDGSFAGCTYKRDSPFSTQPASFSGWHRHVLGSGRLVESLQAGPSPDGSLDSVLLVTNDPATTVRYIEVLTPLFDIGTPQANAWFVDTAARPSLVRLIDANGNVAATLGPIANPFTVATPQNTAVTFDPRINDSDPQHLALTIVSVGAPMNGTATVAADGSSITYTPNTGFSGSDSFSYTIANTQGQTAVSSVTASVAAQVFSVSVSAPEWNWLQTGNAAPTIDSPDTATPTGGAGPFTYAWQFVAGDPAAQPTFSAGASTAWARPMPVAGVFSSVWRCQVTDATGAVSYSPNVAVVFSWLAKGDDSGTGVGRPGGGSGGFPHTELP